MRNYISLEDYRGTEIEKSFINSEDSIEKAGGEGTRGGKIIGHTKSGKPVYERNNSVSLHKHYKSFSEEDHRDAADLHKKLGNTEAYQNHKDMYDTSYDPSEGESYEGFGESKKKKKI